MDKVTLGSTGITVCKNGFGALPIQRVTKDEAVRIIRKAFQGGIQFFDTAIKYTDSEEKLGLALEGIRDMVYLASKTPAKNAEEFWNDLNTTLTRLKTDYLDIFQFHNPAFCPKPGDGTGLYEAMLEAKAQGKIRHIGISNHRLLVAKEVIESGLYETLQFPFSYISGKQEIELVNMCKQRNMGFIAMKGLSGGLLTNYKACYAFEAQFDNVLPIWGIQSEAELDQWLSCIDNPPRMTEEMKAIIEKDRAELAGDFCRGCGYCAPCTVGIKINECARMSQLIRRSPSKRLLEQETIDKMRKVNECIECGVCMTRCPYELKIPELLRKNLEDYENILAGKTKVAIV
jgi:predicted aldo/keto reductase-like oxidoreductase